MLPVADLLAQIRIKYLEYGIKEEPYVVVKADAGSDSSARACPISRSPATSVTVVMTVLSVAAAYGSLVIVFQWGWLQGIGFEPINSIDSTIPPLVLAMTFAAMHYFGIGLHKTSLGALVIALGLLVDDPVVAGDAIKRELGHGKLRVVAAWLGPLKLARAILFATTPQITAGKATKYSCTTCMGALTL